VSERKLKLIVKGLSLTFNEQPIFGPAQGRLYAKFVSLMFILIVLGQLFSSLKLLCVVVGS